MQTIAMAIRKVAGIIINVLFTFLNYLRFRKRQGR
jgi:hypothetical protein